MLYPLVSGLRSETDPLLPAIRANYFGRRAFATITVVKLLVTALLGFTADFPMLLAGWLREDTGSFVPELTLSILIGSAAAELCFFGRGIRSCQVETGHPERR